MTIIEYDEKQKEQWQEYISHSGQSTFFHQLGWRRLVLDSFGHRAHYLCAREGGEIKGILPLFRLKHPFWGDYLISLPFAVYGGICADDEQTGRQLLAAAVRLGEKLGVEHIELRHLQPLRAELACKDLYMTFELELHPDPEIIWKQMRKRNRNILRKGIKSGLKLHRQPTAHWRQPEEGELNTFYHLFARTQTALGTPVLPRRWFSHLLKNFPGQIRLFSTEYQGKIINSLMVFRYKDTLSPSYIGYDHRYLQYAPNNFILWEAIRYGCLNGYRRFDMGRSRRGTGSFNFKRYWGIEPQQLYYQYHLYPGRQMPDLSPSNPKFALAKKIWAKLPVAVAERISAGLVKYLP